MFPEIEAKEALRSNFSYLSPGQAPYYWILISIEYFAFKSALELDGTEWLLTAVIISLMMAIGIVKATTEICETDVETEISQLRVARIVGISTPFLSLAFTISRIKLDFDLFYIALVVSCIQAAVFLFIIKEKSNEQQKKINIPQLLVICTSLIFSIHASLASLATRGYILELPQNLILQYGDTISKETTKLWNEGLHIKSKTANFALKEEAGPVQHGLFSFVYDLGADPGIQKRFVDDAKYQTRNLTYLSSLLCVLWVIALVRISIRKQ